MNTKITIEQLAEKLGETVWSKGDLKRIYMNDAGWNTKNMTTKTWIFINPNGKFEVACHINCPSQPDAWIVSQEKEVKENVYEKIEAAVAEIGTVTDEVETVVHERLKDVKWRDVSRTVETKTEAIEKAIAELRKFKGDENYNDFHIVEIPEGTCDVTDFYPAIQIIDNEKCAANTTWIYTEMGKTEGKWLITSPCYRNNGYNGIYVSYAETDENGEIIFGVGDHFFSFDDFKVKYATNISELQGMPYSDSDRFIKIKKFEGDTEFVHEYFNERKQYAAAMKIWESAKNEPEAYCPVSKDYYNYDDFCRELIVLANSNNQ